MILVMIFVVFLLYLLVIGNSFTVSTLLSLINVLLWAVIIKVVNTVWNI